MDMFKQKLIQIISMGSGILSWALNMDCVPYPSVQLLVDQEKCSLRCRAAQWNVPNLLADEYQQQAPAFVFSMLLLPQVPVMPFFWLKTHIFILREVKGSSDPSLGLWIAEVKGPCAEGSLSKAGSCVWPAFALFIYIFACLLYPSCPPCTGFVCPYLLQALAFDFQIIILLENMGLCCYKRIHRITSMGIC